MLCAGGATAGPSRADGPRPALVWVQMVDSSHGYALSGRNADDYRLLWTADGGRSWRDVTPGNGTTHPSGPLSILGRTRLFATKLRQGVFAVERSDDGGRTWRRSLPIRTAGGQGAGPPFALDRAHLFLAVDLGAAAGSQGEALYTSSDDGRRWRLRSQTDVSSTPRGSLPFGCDKSGFGFSTPSRGWAGGYCPGGAPFFYRSDDGGRTWRRQTLPAPTACACETLAPLFFSPGVGATAVSGFTTNGAGKPLVRVFWTTDGGAHWRTSDPPVGRAGDIRFADAQNVWIVAQRRGNLRAPYNVLARTTDAGQHWLVTKLPFDMSGYHLDPLSATVAYGWRVSASNVIVRTNDGGRTWSVVHAALRGGYRTAHRRLSGLDPRASVSAIEENWRNQVSYMAAGNPRASPRAAATTRRRLLAAIEASGGKAVRVDVRRAMEPAPEVVIATSHPAAYLKHELKAILRITRPDRNVYLAVVDGTGTRVLEWAINGDKTPSSGSLYVRPGLERCSPIAALGWPMHLPPCPAR